MDKYDEYSPEQKGYPHEQNLHDWHVRSYYQNHDDDFWWRLIDQDSEWIKQQENRDEVF